MAENLLSTKEVAKLLKINEKMVYALISEKGLPATKVTGKWLFPQDLVENWIHKETVNCPSEPVPLPDYHGLLIIAGSNDILLDRTLSLFNKNHPEHVAIFGNLGSMGGIRALKKRLCHIATSHLLEEKGDEYNFGIVREVLTEIPAIVNFCRREQGILVAKGNPKQISSIADFGRSDVCIVNRAPGTGTRLLVDMELKQAGIDPENVNGYVNEVHRHLDVGIEVLSGRADAGAAISAVAGLLDLDFIPLRWERFDLLISKDRFFDEGIQLFLSLLHESSFRELGETLRGYEMSLSGKMVFARAEKERQGLYSERETG
jgi:excisionase family DNA binding protein